MRWRQPLDFLATWIPLCVPPCATKQRWGILSQAFGLCRTLRLSGALRWWWFRWLRWVRWRWWHRWLTMNEAVNYWRNSESLLLLLFEWFKTPTEAKKLICNFSLSRFVFPSFPSISVCQDSNPDDEYTIACLLMVFIAVSIPRLARMENSQYKPSLEAHANNAHCLAKVGSRLLGYITGSCQRVRFGG